MPLGKKVGGRTKGVPNKKTLLKKQLKLDQWSGLLAFIEGPGLERFIQEMNELKGKEYITAYNSIAEYVKPKLTRVEQTGAVQNIHYNVDLTKDEIKEITNAFENDF